MKSKEKYCPFCGKKINRYDANHIYKCKCRDMTLTKEELKLKLLQFNFGENILEDVCKDYESLYSLPMLNEKYSIDSKSVYFLLSLKNIKPRSISESSIKISQEKFRKTCREKYGVDNVSQAKEIQDKKEKTFMEHYGVTNIWKLQGYAKKCMELHPEVYEIKMQKLFAGRDKAIKDKCFLSSSLEIRFCSILENLYISYTRQFYLKKYKHPYDFRLTESNIIIEINGDYWHCNPKLYSPDYYHKIKHKTAEEIWEYDKKHIIKANECGYKVIEIWEYDMNSMNDDELTKYFLELLNNI